MREFRPFQVRMPSGDRYWTVVDSAYRPVPEADEWLLHVRLGRDCAESTTEAYARSLALFLDWCTDGGPGLAAGAGPARPVHVLGPALRP